MGDAVEKQAPFRDLLGNVSAFSHDKTEIVLKKVGVYVLEMEDVLFHHDSAVMMPDGPSMDGSKSQSKVKGVRAIALIFKEIEFDPDKRVLVTGHTDTSGKDSYNFKLSKERSLDVLYVMTGERDKWVDISYGHHKVEDYQQIMVYFYRTRGWKCNPGKVDDKWSEYTRQAIDGFVQGYNENFVGKYKDKDGNDFTPLPENISARSVPAPHKWPKELWAAVFNLYTQDICDALSVSQAELGEMQKPEKLKFVDDKKQYVACGESFPIEDANKQNYRSQTNRRVEILMFDKDELPVLDCPTDTSKAHKEKDCPIWHRWHFMPIYIDPGDLNSVVYHMSFRYYNYVLRRWEDVPEGLEIEAFEIRKLLKNKRLDTVTEFKKKGDRGVYCVKVRFGTPLDKKKKCQIYFEFNTKGKKDTKNKYVFTKNDKSDPQIKLESADDVKKLPFRDRCHYYDLPERWRSRHCWTRYDGDMTKSEQFFKVLREIKKFKPWGSALTKPDEPLIFCLDDLILTDNRLRPVKQSIGKFECAILDHQFAVHDPDTDHDKPYYTKNGIEITKDFRYIRVPLPNKRLGGVVIKHSADNKYKLFASFADRVPAAHRLCGHRAAVYDHKTMCIKVDGFQQKHRRHVGTPWTIGNYNSYLLRDQDFNEDGEEVSYIFNHFLWHFKRCTGTTTDTCATADAGPPTWPIADANWQPWISTAVTNLTNEYNHQAAGQLVSLYYKKDKDTYRIYLRYYIEHMISADAKVTINVHKPSGGRSNMGRTEGNIKCNEHQHKTPVPPDTSIQFTAAHEYGHATSLDDEYAENGDYCSYVLPGVVDFKQGSPFLHDDDKGSSAMMRGNEVVRTRHYQHFAEWLYDDFKKPHKLLFEIHRRNDPVYKLPHNTASDWDPRDDTKTAKGFVNYPSKIHLDNTNSVSTQTYKGKFHTYLYPLGSDPFSDGILRTGEKFTGIVVVNVNVFISSWSGGILTWDVYRQLDRWKADIKARFQDAQGVKIEGDAPYKSTFVIIQPRFLVNYYAPDYNAQLGQTHAQFNAHRDAALATAEGATKHLIVSISASASSVDLTKSPPEVNLRNNNAGRAKFWRYFSHALGLPYGGQLRKTNFGIGTFVPNGTVKDI